MDTATLKALREVIEAVAMANAAGSGPGRIGSVHLAHAAHRLIVATGVNPEETMAHLRYLVDEDARAAQRVPA